MGCVICNMLVVSNLRDEPMPDAKEMDKLDQELWDVTKDEMCSDIAHNHPEMVERILYFLELKAKDKPLDDKSKQLGRLIFPEHKEKYK